MNNYEVLSLLRRNLFYLTHINNLPSILKYGILSRKEINKQNVHYKDISDQQVQRRRQEWHDYVPLFFADNTPMLYVTWEKFNGKVALLEVDKKIILENNIKFTNGNLASLYTHIYDDITDLKKLKFEIIYHRGGAFSDEWKRIRAAEVLVPHKVSPEYFICIHVSKYINLPNLPTNLPIKKDLSQTGIIWR